MIKIGFKTEKSLYLIIKFCESVYVCRRLYARLNEWKSYLNIKSYCKYDIMLSVIILNWYMNLTTVIIQVCSYSLLEQQLSLWTPLVHYTVMEKALITKLAQVSQQITMFAMPRALFSYIHKTMSLFIYRLFREDGIWGIFGRVL